MENSDSTPAAIPSHPGWFGRNWKWFVPVFLLLSPIMIYGGLVILHLTAFIHLTGPVGEMLDGYQDNQRIKASEPFKMAMDAIKADAEVVKQLGEPLEVVGQVSGEVPKDAKAQTGNARFFFDIKGPKGSAKVQCQGKMIDGKWGLSTLNVTFADNKRHSVEVGGNDSLDEAPPFKP